MCFTCKCINVHDVGQPSKSNAPVNYVHAKNYDVTQNLTYLQYFIRLIEEKRSDCCNLSSSNQKFLQFNKRF